MDAEEASGQDAAVEESAELAFNEARKRDAAGALEGQEGIEVIANDLTSTPGTAGRRNPAGYRAFRGLMSWSINWERLANLDFSRNHRAYLNALPPP